MLLGAQTSRPADVLVRPAHAVLHTIPALRPGHTGAVLVVNRAAAPPRWAAGRAGSQAPRLIRAVSTVVHPITSLVSIDPALRVTAVKNQVCWQAAGQVTTEFLLLILSISAVGSSITDMAGWDAGHSVIAQEACPVMSGYTVAVHRCMWLQSQCDRQAHDGHYGSQEQQHNEGPSRWAAQMGTARLAAACWEAKVGSNEL